MSADAMSNVFVVQHERRIPVPAEVKLIGVYSSQGLADAAVSRLRTRPGFRDLPDGFSVSKIALDLDHWTEGFGVPHESAGDVAPVVACAFCTQTVTPAGEDPLEVFVRGAVTDSEQGLYAHAACLRDAVHLTVPLLVESENR